MSIGLSYKNKEKILIEKDVERGYVSGLSAVGKDRAWSKHAFSTRLAG